MEARQLIEMSKNWIGEVTTTAMIAKIPMKFGIVVRRASPVDFTPFRDSEEMPEILKQINKKYK